ncbi:MAG: EcsC family protein [Ginsengibacter sp.]
MHHYADSAREELADWQKKMLQKPGLFNNLSKKIQVKINSYIPENVHNAITVALKQMIRGVLFSAKITTGTSLPYFDFEMQEIAVQKKIDIYRQTAAVEGGITGAGGILLGLADFPILIGIKIKLLFEIATIYGYDIKNYKERVYLLHIFELAFSSDIHRKNIYLKMTNWEEKAKELPEDINQFDWRNFQQEYRDYLDLAKLAQLIPVVGAPVGYIVNNRLLKKLGVTAMNAYRMRKFEGE